MNDNFMHNLRAAVDRLVPSYTVAHNARGNELVDSGGYDTAIAEFDEAIRLTPFVAEIYSDHGRAHAVKGDVGLALADYDEAIRLRPQEADFYTNMGAARRMAGDDEGARRDYDEAIRPRSVLGAGAFQPGEPTKTTTFSLPPEMAERVDEAIQQQGRSRSEFLREAMLLVHRRVRVAAIASLRRGDG